MSDTEILEPTEELQLEMQGSSYLTAICDPVTDSRQQVVPYADKMLAAMRKKRSKRRGVGLSAPQVGIRLRFFVSKIDGCEISINPTWTPVGPLTSSQSESCLSFPGKLRYKKRHREIRATWTDTMGNRKTRVLHDFHARIFQHECDHLDGICLF